MRTKRLLKSVAADFGLEPKGSFKHIVLPNRSILIRTFLCGCPDPMFMKHGNNNPEISRNLVRFIKSKDFASEVRNPHACVIYRRGLENELSLIPAIPDPLIRREVAGIYSMIKKALINREQIVLMWREKTLGSACREEVLLHEFLHEVINNNNLRPHSWKWNEGVVSYLTRYAFGEHKRYEKPPKRSPHSMGNIYKAYTHRVAKRMMHSKTPAERRKILAAISKK